MSILASMMLFALAGAENTAKEMRTRATIDKINNAIMEKYESYRTRRLPLDVQDVARAKGYNANPKGWAEAAARHGTGSYAVGNA